MKPLIEKTLILGHRGASGYAPENTLEAFALAIDMKADGIELDVYFTADKQIVICHDEKIDRTSNGQGLIRDYTLAELKQLDFGYHFYNGERRGIRIPTLDEVFALVAPTDMIINVEIKDGDPEIVKACDELARKYDLQNRIIYSSFNHFQLEVVKETVENAFFAPLYSVNLLKPWNYTLDIGAQAVHPKYLQIYKIPDYIRICHEKGLRVHTWTVNKEEDMQLLLDNGIDIIVTNYPDVAMALRDKAQG